MSTAATASQVTSPSPAPTLLSTQAQPLHLATFYNPTSQPRCHMVITPLPCSTTSPCPRLHPHFQSLNACFYRIPTTSFASRSCRKTSQFRNPVLWIRRHFASPPPDDFHLCPACVHSSQHDSTLLTSCHLHTLWPCLYIYIYLCLTHENLFWFFQTLAVLDVWRLLLRSDSWKHLSWSMSGLEFFKPWWFLICGTFLWSQTHGNTCFDPCQGLSDCWSLGSSSSVWLKSHITATVSYGHHCSSVLHHIPLPTAASTSTLRLFALPPHRLYFALPVTGITPLSHICVVKKQKMLSLLRSQKTVARCSWPLTPPPDHHLFPPAPTFRSFTLPSQVLLLSLL